MYIPPSFENNLLLPRPVLSIALYFQCSAMQPLAILEIEKSLHMLKGRLKLTQAVLQLNKT